MNDPQPVIVMDTNTLVRGMAHAASASGRVLEGCRKKTISLLLSKPVLAEYRKVLRYEEILKRNPELTPEHVRVVLQRLAYVGEFPVDTQVVFVFERDLADAKFLELAIAGRATHLITHDHDLLSLAEGHSDAARRLRRQLPRVKIVTADAFWNGIRKAKP